MLEQLSVARYHMYSLVYWDPRCRAFTALLRDAVVTWLRDLLARNPPEGWTEIAAWVRSGSDESALQLLERSGGHLPSVLEHLEDIRCCRTPITVAEISSAHPAFVNLKHLGAETERLATTLAVPPWASQRGLCGGGTNLVESIRDLARKEWGVDDIRLVVDVPMQEINEEKWRRCGVVTEDGRVLRPGPIWDAAVPAMDRWVMRIRVGLCKPRLDLATGRRLQARLQKMYS